MDAEDGGGAAARMNVEEVLTKPVQSPSGVQKKICRRARSASCPDGWVGGDQKGLSIVLILIYIKRKDVLISNLPFKVEDRLLIKSCKYFSFLFFV